MCRLSRADDKRHIFSQWLLFAIVIGVVSVVGIFIPEIFITLLALSFIIVGALHGIVRCSPHGLVFGFGFGLSAYYGGGIFASMYGQDFTFININSVVYVSLVASAIAILPYLTTTSILAFWSYRRRGVPGMSLKDGFSWATYDEMK